MANKTNIIIGMPCQNTILAINAFSLMQTVRSLPTDIEWDFILRQDCDIVGSRTWLARRAKEMGGTHVLFVDDDMFFATDKENPIVRLLGHHKEIVGASYNFRYFPLKSTAIPLDLEPNEAGKYEILAKDLPKDLYKVKALGTGFLLIDLTVFDKIPEPWFQFGRDDKGQLISGEDTHFCQMAIAAGYDVWADPSIVVKHIGEFLF